MEVAHPAAAEILLEAGATRGPAGRLLIGPAPVERALASAPSSVSLHDREGALRADLGGWRVHFTPGSSAIHLLDPSGRGFRRPLTSDYVRYARLCQGLQAVDYPSTAFIPADVDGRISDSWRLFLSLVHGSRPVVTGAFTVDGLAVMHEMLLAVRGSAGELRKRPLAVFSSCPTAPLQWSEEAAAGVIECGRRGIPVEIISMPLTGFVAPGTLVGTLVQHTAELLSGLVLSQSAAPGAPVLWGGSPAIFDYRFESTPVGAVESQMIACAFAAVGRHLGVPTQAYVSLSDSRELDAQAGLETATGAVLAGLAGINSISGAGMLAFENAFSLEKLAVDDEICASVKRLLDGISIREGDFPARPHFEEMGREGHLLISEHTRRWFGEEVRFPGEVIDRCKEPPDPGASAPALPERARRRVEALAAGGGEPAAPDLRRELERIMARAAKDAGMEELPDHGL